MSAEHCESCDPAFSCWAKPEDCRKPDSRAHWAEAIGSGFWRPIERAVIDKYRVDTLRHAANAIFNKLGEAYTCGLNTEQGRTALFDAQTLADVIVKSHAATEAIGHRPNSAYEPTRQKTTGSK